MMIGFVRPTALIAALVVVAVLPEPSTAFVESWLSSSDLRSQALQKLVVNKPATTNSKNKETTTNTNQKDIRAKKVAPVAPVSIHPGPDTKIISDGNDHHDEPVLSLGKPIAFETPLFKGKILIRLKNALSSDSDPQRHHQYFGPNQKRLMQTVVQGQFKKPIKMSDVYVGTVLTKPLAKKPPAIVAKVLEKAFRAVQPGAIVDIASDQPKVIALYSGSAQAVSCHHPDDITKDDLPDIVASDRTIDEIEYLPHLEEEIKSGGNSQQRMKHLGHPNRACKYEYDAEHVYTFHIYNEVLDFGLGMVQVPLLGPHDLKPLIGNQPFQMSAISSQGETLYNFEIRHHSNSNDHEDPAERLMP